MGELYYDQLGLSAGTPVTATPDIMVGPFNNIQPYQNWSCEGASNSLSPCFADGPANNFEYSFSFGNGFEGTDILANDLYVMVYFPDQIFVNGFEAVEDPEEFEVGSELSAGHDLRTVMARSHCRSVGEGQDDWIGLRPEE